MRRVSVLLALAILGCGPKKADPPAPDAGNATVGPRPAATTGTTAPVPAPADPAPAAASETVIQYRWSGGLSQYQWYAMTIRGTDTAKITFAVKPVRSDEKHAEDTLDAKDFAALKDLFEKVGFDSLKTKARGARILDMGQTVLSREGGGKAKKEILQNGITEIDGDMKPLRDWLDFHVQMYLEKSGAKPHEK